MDRFTSHTRVHNTCLHALRYRAHSPGSPAIRFAPDPAPQGGRETAAPIHITQRRRYTAPNHIASPRPPSGSSANLRSTGPH